MIDIDRRTATLLAMFSPLLAATSVRAGQLNGGSAKGAHNMRTTPPGWVRDEVIAMLVYPQMTALDLVGPHHMFSALMGAHSIR